MTFTANEHPVFQWHSHLVPLSPLKFGKICCSCPLIILAFFPLISPHAAHTPLVPITRKVFYSWLCLNSQISNFISFQKETSPSQFTLNYHDTALTQYPSAVPNLISHAWQRWWTAMEEAAGSCAPPPAQGEGCTPQDSNRRAPCLLPRLSSGLCTILPHIGKGNKQNFPMHLHSMSPKPSSACLLGKHQHLWTEQKSTCARADESIPLSSSLQMLVHELCTITELLWGRHTVINVVS